MKYAIDSSDDTREEIESIRSGEPIAIKDLAGEVPNASS